MRAKPQELVSGQRPPPLEFGLTREASTTSRVMARKKPMSSFGSPQPKKGKAAVAAKVPIPRKTAISGHASRLRANRFIRWRTFKAADCPASSAFYRYLWQIGRAH